MKFGGNLFSKNSSSNPQVGLEYLDANVRAEIEEMMDGESDLIIDLIDTLLESTPEQLDAIDAGLASSDPQVVGDAGHALKSAMAQMGALTLSGLCKDLEALGRKNSLEGMAAINQQVKSEYQKVTQALEAWKVSLS